MAYVYFTQFLFSDGRVRSDYIEMSNEISALAEELRKEGWSFEIECFPGTGLIHADVCDDEEPIADETCKNGPEVPAMIERLVRSAHAAWIERGRPKAQGDRLAGLERRMGADYG
jgi:hypothetical protein